MRRLFCLILCLTLLSGMVFAVETSDEDTLSSRIQEFIVANGLNGSNFALSYFNSDTGESYSFNQNAYFPAGDLWKLPLHMYYYEQDSLGAYDPPPEDPTYVFTIGDMTLGECHYRSIILGDNEVALKMREALGSHDQFKLTVNEAFGHVSEEYLTEEFYQENKFSTQFWINALQAVSSQTDLFQDMMRNYNMVQTADGFATYGKAYPLVHIRGEEDGFICDVGEISGPETYLLACCVSEEAGGDAVLAEINALICTYVEECADVTELSGGDTFVRGDAAMTVVSAGNNDKNAALVWIGIALGGALVLAGILALTFWIFRRRREDYYD